MDRIGNVNFIEIRSKGRSFIQVNFWNFQRLGKEIFDVVKEYRLDLSVFGNSKSNNFLVNSKR